MFKHLQQPLAALVEAKSTAAKASGSLSFTSSSLYILRTEAGLPFQLRYCPSLAKKPLPNKDTDNTSNAKKKVNPFENPEPELFITDVPTDPSIRATHFLILNKFPIIPSHFILATKTNKAQTDVLEREDVAAAFECLKAWEDGQLGRRLYGFFNSGNESGASQAHRHLQFVPVEGMRQDDVHNEWNVLMDEVVGRRTRLPFVVYWEPVSADTSADELYAMYNRLYNKAHEAVKLYVASNPGELELTNNGWSSPFSYNLGFTTSALCIIPRRREGTALYKKNGKEIGFAAFNGTVLAGTMMVKNEEEWDLLRGDKYILASLLQDIGIPSVEMNSSNSHGLPSL